MGSVKELVNKSIPSIIKSIGMEGLVTVDLYKLAHKLKVSVLPQDFGTEQINGEEIICAFVTNEKGNSAIFYNDNLVCNKVFFTRIMITKAFAKYIITGSNNFFITQSTPFSNRENRLISEMLMPEIQVEDVLNKLILPTTAILSDIFNVPKEFVSQRLEEMKITKRVVGYNFII